MSKKRYLTIFLIVCTQSIFAQYTRLTVDAFAGVPLSLTFFSPTVAVYGGVGIRYSLLKEISFNAQISGGTMTGTNKAVNTSLALTDVTTNYQGFTNNFYQYTGGGQINLERVFHLRRISLFQRLNPYLNAGGGIIHSDVSATRIPDANGNVYKREYVYNFYTAYVGLEFRYYMNPSLDFIVGSNFNMADTKFNDAVPIDNKSDNYLLNHVGIAYKVGARKDRQHIEWNNVILRDRIYIPDIEKRQGQPLDQAGNYFVFHKDTITKMQLDNMKLMDENKKQSEQIARQQVEIMKLQGDVTEMKVQIDTLKAKFDTLQSQVNDIRDGQGATKIIYLPAKPGKEATPVKERPAPRRTNPDNTGTEEPVIRKNPVTREPAVAKPRVVTPERQPVIREQPISQAEPTVIENAQTKELNKIDGVVAPVAKYNVIVGAYVGTRFAYAFRDKLRAKGYNAAVFKSRTNSRILRVCAFTTDDRQEAISMMRKVRTEIDPQAWIHVFSGQ